MNLELTSVIACQPFNYVGDPGGQIDAWKKHGYDKNGSATIMFDYYNTNCDQNGRPKNRRQMVEVGLHVINIWRNKSDLRP